MWLKIIKEIQKEKLDSISDLYTYTITFAKLFNIQLLNQKELEIKILENISIFPENDFLYDSLNNGLCQNIISFFSQLHFLNLDFLSIQDNNIYDKIISEDGLTTFYQQLNFQPEILLSNYQQNNTLTFLFLYFLPSKYKNSLLFHPIKKIPLISFNKITIEYFNMLLYLMKTYEIKEFNILTQNNHKNLNHLLVEETLKTSIKTFNYNENLDWGNILPKNKIIIFFSEKIYLNNFENYLDSQMQNLYSGINTVLINMQTEYEFLKLNNTLADKSKPNKKLIKI